MPAILGGSILSSLRAALVAGVALAHLTAGAQNVPADAKGKAANRRDPGFSFAAYGDSRPMMYLPIKDGQLDATRLFVEMFGLVLPEKVAEEVVKKDVKLIFDPATKELIRVIMPFASKSEVMTLTVDKGWVT